MEWEIVYYSEDLQRTIMEFPAGIQARYIHLTQRMLAFGPGRLRQGDCVSKLFA